ncbi:STAS/SEC14 domain-containing protein [Flavobacterium sp. ARAG 55.4]|uniref:STAS/SEC14 domain-containing protein n=1 Tax=Flavobacterium plantiphilum TaxID=3163297 RepID=A0ABW8XYK9_9FLAO
MIELIKTVPNTIAAFRITGEVCQEDYKAIVIPEVENLIKQINYINLLLVLETDLENFATCAWAQDAMLGLQNMGRWNRGAIVTNSETIITFTNGFCNLVSGEFKGFKKEEYDHAVLWVSEELLLNE